MKRFHMAHKLTTWLLAFGMMLVSLDITAADNSTLKPKDIIFEHIQDTYWWHIATINGKEISIPLPVIVRSSETGWHIFSSHHLEHGGSHKGFYLSSGEKHAGKIVERNTHGQEIRPLDISLTKNALAVIINSAILVIIFLCVARWYKRHTRNDVPKGFIGLVELLVMSIEDDVIRPNVGKDHARYSPYLLTAFFFIFINNLMGLIPIFPGGANTTGNITITFFLAICTMFAVNIFGNKEYWKDILWPNVPWWLKVPIPLMPAIELFGVLSKPFALMIRLFANIMAGHSVIIAITCLVFVTAKMGIAMNTGMTVFSVILSIFMNCLEVLVAYVQAFVFTMLSSVFIGLSRPQHHGKEE